MRLKRKIHTILGLCVLLLFSLGWYFNSFQKELQNSHDPFMALGNSHPQVHKPDKDSTNNKSVHVAALVGLYINTKLQEMNFTRNHNYKVVLRKLTDDLRLLENHTSPSVIWSLAESWVGPRQVNPDESPGLGMVLNAMATSPILLAEVPRKGTQLKAMFTLQGNQSIFFKPMRYSRDHIIQDTPYAGADRHNGEIASFHLNRILGFNRCPLVVGRKVRLRSEVQRVATPALSKTFFNKGPDVCFFGVCYYCQPTEPACGDGEVLEGALLLSFPSAMKLKRIRSPWRRTYKANVSARWELDSHYCEKVTRAAPFSRLPMLLDAVDASVLDYLIGNADRHSYELFSHVKNPAILILDNGKSFGNPYWDELTILAPLYQCCRIRQNTVDRLELFVDNLGAALEELLMFDPLAPILTKPHLDALDRRLRVVLAAIAVCIEREGGAHKVLVS